MIRKWLDSARAYLLARKMICKYVEGQDKFYVENFRIVVQPGKTVSLRSVATTTTYHFVSFELAARFIVNAERALDDECKQARRKRKDEALRLLKGVGE